MNFFCMILLLFKVDAQLVYGSGEQERDWLSLQKGLGYSCRG